ncbi:MAG: FAD-dependent oxidoreductase [Pseudomonadota bacterium]
MEKAGILIVGAGIFGLAAAWALSQRGHRPLVVDRVGPGAGASGGPLGALTPFSPERWSEKKALQLEALTAAEGFWQEIAAASGQDPGYGRIGRLIPLRSAEERARAETRAADALRHWAGTAAWKLRDETGPIEPTAAPFGVVHETLSGRVDPKRAMAALAAGLETRDVEIRTGWQAERIGPEVAEFDRGPIAAETIVIAAGAATDTLIGPLAGAPSWPGVAGEAARLDADLAGTPLIAAPGLYIVPHADGTVAVGATKERAGDDAPDLDALLAAAGDLLPTLRTAPVLERWRGVRPRGRWPDPVIGRLPRAPRIVVATGGYGIGFGLAPRIGEAVADLVEGRIPALPPRFALGAHLPAEADGAPT